MAQIFSYSIVIKTSPVLCTVTHKVIQYLYCNSFLFMDGTPICSRLLFPPFSIVLVAINSTNREYANFLCWCTYSGRRSDLRVTTATTASNSENSDSYGAIKWVRSSYSYLHLPSRQRVSSSSKFSPYSV